MTKYNSNLGIKFLEKTGTLAKIKRLREENHKTIWQIAKELNLSCSTVRMVLRYLNIV